MNNRIEEKITDVWNEVITKEQLKCIIKMMSEIKDDQINTRKIIKEELTNLWNISEIPTFKQILEKLTIIQTILHKEVQEESSTSELVNSLEEKKPELVHVNVWTRCKEPILVDISEVKPKLSEGVKNVVKNLANLNKKGKF